MAKRVIAMADIERLAGERLTVLRLEPGDTITPLARDRARELGITVYEPGEVPPAPVEEEKAEEVKEVPTLTEEKVEELVKAIAALVKEKAPPCPVPEVYGTRPGAIKLVKMPKEKEIPLYDLPGAPPEIEFRLLDVVTVEDGSSMGGGFMSWQKGGFNWTLTYDQIDFVLEGCMEVTWDGRTIRAYPGDVVFIPKGTSITWSTPSWVKVWYVTFPAEWAAE